GGGLGCGGEKASIDLMFFAIGEDFLSERVFAHEAGTGEWERGTEFGEVHQDVIGRAASALGLGGYIGERLALGIDINDLDLINDPVASSQDPSPGRNGFCLHL